jgi:MinD-like ATPase involved in chromosome partitioning or flagellar assembly
LSYVISFYGVKDGQGVTTTAVSLACELALQHSTLFLDADMSGTGTAVDLLLLDPAGRGMNNLIGGRVITAQDLLAQAVGTRLPRLGLVPGLIAVCGSSVPRLADQLRAGSALNVPGVDFLVVDFGAIAHPEQRSLRQAVTAIAAVSHRVFSVIRDDPPLLARSLQVLKAALPPKTELLLLESRRGAVRKQAEEALRLRLPELPLAGRIPWDPARAMGAADGGKPIALGDLFRQLQVAQRAQPVLTQAGTTQQRAGAPR